jgi:hypothetical protein
LNDEDYPAETREIEQDRCDVQIVDFERIEWVGVMSGRQRAASYLVRKGLSRKAQLALQVRRFLCKQPSSILNKAVPTTIILETWDAHEEDVVKVDFGGVKAAFSSTSVFSSGTDRSLRKRLEQVLSNAQLEFDSPSREGWMWILKPSVTNKGLQISLCAVWEEVLDCLESCPDVREWVLQRYIEDPLLLPVTSTAASVGSSVDLHNPNFHKFHLRVYVICVGALRVYVYDQILLLLAAHPYSLGESFGDKDDLHRHLTNTARAAEAEAFDEAVFVRTLQSDLPAALGAHWQSGARKATRPPHIDEEAAAGHEAKRTAAALKYVRKQIWSTVSDLFAAFENEYTVFAPMNNCFEIYGLDFLLDQRLELTLLEVNPGPDFKQTGDRLDGLIEDLWDQTLGLALDGVQPSSSDGGQSSDPRYAAERTGRLAYRDCVLVYDKQLSASKVESGMTFT